MTKLLKNQSGLIDLFIVTVAVLILVGAGVYLYARHLNSSPAYTPPGLGTGKTKSAAGTTSSGYLTITQWSVKLKTTSDITDLDYVINGNAASFSSKSLEAAGGKYCIAEQGPLGTIAQYNPGQTVGPGAGTTVESLQGARKIGDHYYYFTWPQATCSDSAQVQSLETKQSQALSNAVSTSLQAK